MEAGPGRRLTAQRGDVGPYLAAGSMGVKRKVSHPGYVLKVGYVELWIGGRVKIRGGQAGFQNLGSQ